MSLEMTEEEDMLLVGYLHVGFRYLNQIRQTNKQTNKSLYEFLGPHADTSSSPQGRSAFLHSRAAEDLSLLALPPTDVV